MSRYDADGVPYDRELVTDPFTVRPLDYSTEHDPDGGTGA